MKFTFMVIVGTLMFALFVPLDNVYSQSPEKVEEGMRSAIDQRENDECFFGPSHIRRVTTLSMETDIEHYNDALRQEQIKNYIVNNKDSLEIPDDVDSDLVLCAVAMDVVNHEMDISFKDQELENNIGLAVAARYNTDSHIEAMEYLNQSASGHFMEYTQGAPTTFAGLSGALEYAKLEYAKTALDGTAQGTMELAAAIDLINQANEIFRDRLGGITSILQNLAE